MKLDSSPRVFGQATADAVPPFDEPVNDGAVPAALMVQARLANIDLVRTLGGLPAATFRRGTQRLDGARKRATGGLPSRVTETMLRIATVLERGGAQPMDVLVRFATRGKPPTTRHAVATMQAYGLVESLQIRDTLRGTFGRPIMVHQLTAKGFKHLVQDRLRTRRWSYTPRPSLNAPQLRVLGHHVGAVSWTVELLDAVGPLAEPWFTPAWADGHLDVPTIRVNGARGRMTPDTAPRTDGLNATTTIASVTEFKPDVLVWVDAAFADGTPGRLPLMVEYDRVAELPYNLRKILNWEAWRIAIMRHHPLFTGLGDHLGALAVVVQDRAFLLRLMQALDQGHTTATGEHFPPLRGNVSPTGTPVAYYAGRENLYFILEEDLHRGSVRAFQIPPMPPKERGRVGQPTDFRFHRTTLLRGLDTDLRGTQGRDYTGLPRMPNAECRTMSLASPSRSPQEVPYLHKWGLRSARSTRGAPRENAVLV
ncbi:MAG TPA: hypothetical protein VN238_17560 [Solirubrobacteraceae bacterium]|nr:hypothetical protein [Solirubrobacteraceae bacterium]